LYKLKTQIKKFYKITKGNSHSIYRIQTVIQVNRK